MLSSSNALDIAHFVSTSALISMTLYFSHTWAHTKGLAAGLTGKRLNADPASIADLSCSYCFVLLPLNNISFGIHRRLLPLPQLLRAPHLCFGF